MPNDNSEITTNLATRLHKKQSVWDNYKMW